MGDHRAILLRTGRQETANRKQETEKRLRGAIGAGFGTFCLLLSVSCFIACNLNSDVYAAPKFA